MAFIISLKSRKLLAFIVWTLVLQWLWFEQWWFGKLDPGFTAFLYANTVFALSYLGIQGWQDIAKEESGNFFDRKFVVALVQILHLVEGIGLRFYLRQKGVDYTMPYMSELALNGGASLAAFCGIAWTSKGAKP
ncbi:MAG: hypothetical protein Q7U75_05360, partial [Desulfobacterales bacterium]|nr:hypothetical protein [Desulfobacterales bacterium]